MRIRNTVNGNTADVSEATARRLGAQWKPIAERPSAVEPAIKKAAPRKRTAKKTD